jgi:hypothetical protein
VVTLVAALLLTLPPGFREAPKLEAAAAFVAGKPAHVFCANTFSDWAQAVADAYGPGVNVNAYSTIGGSETYLPAGFVCALPIAAVAGQKVDLSGPLAGYLLTLVHEAIHQRGVADEGQTECAAMHELPRVAVRFFHVKAGKQLRALMAQAWAAHRRKSAAYQSVC